MIEKRTIYVHPDVVLGEVNRRRQDATVQPAGIAHDYLQHPWEPSASERDAAVAAVEELNKAREPVAILNFWNALTHMKLRPLTPEGKAKAEKAHRLVHETMDALAPADSEVIERLAAIRNGEYSRP